MISEIRQDAWDALSSFMQRDYEDWRAAHKQTKEKQKSQSQKGHRDETAKAAKKVKKVPKVYEVPRFAQVKVRGLDLYTYIYII